MATQVQWRGGSTAEHATFTGAAREITVDTQKQTLVVHDGSTVGGEALLREDQANLPGSVTNGIYTPGTNQVAVATNGTGRLIILSDGKVGLGAASVLQQGSGVDGGSGAGILELYNGGTGNTTLENTGAFPILFKTSGTERLRITSAGLVGIGTSSPEADLHINDAAGLARLRFTGGAVGADNFEIGQAIVGVSNSGFSIYDVDEAATRFVIDSSGNVGIGTASPSSYSSAANNLVIAESGGNAGLTIRTDSANIGAIFFADGTASGAETGAGQISYDHSADAMRFTTAVSERARIDSSGRLLVGTSTARGNFFNTSYTPQLQLEGVGQQQSMLSVVNSVGADGGSVLALGKQRSGSIGGNTILQSGDQIGELTYQGSDGTELVAAASITAYVDGTPGANDMPGRLVFSTTADGASSPTERMRISSDGHTYWGVANPGTTAFGTAIGRLGSLGFFQTARNVDGTGEVAFFHGNAGEVRIFGDGDLENTNNSYGGLSDLKLKENIVDASSQWSDLKALQVRKYNFKAETGYSVHTQIGLVAQEVELVSPGLVGETIDEETGESTKSVNYSVLYMKAVKALQETMERIETLEQRLNDAGIN
jgi:hypothetical protein